MAVNKDYGDFLFIYFFLKMLKSHLVHLIKNKKKDNHY